MGITCYYCSDNKRKEKQKIETKEKDNEKEHSEIYDNQNANPEKINELNLNMKKQIEAYIQERSNNSQMEEKVINEKEKENIEKFNYISKINNKNSDMEKIAQINKKNNKLDNNTDEINEEKKENKKIHDFPLSIPINSLSIISNQQNNIFKIELINEGKNLITGTGFFCNIPFPDKYNTLPVLITNNHILGEKDISINQTVKLIQRKEFQKEQISIYEIFIDKFRKTYTDEKYDITIIEIKKEEDNLDINSLLEIDTMIFEDYSNEEYNDKPIYLLHYKKEETICEYSPGIIKGINKDNYTIEHLCQTESGSSGAPIFNSTTNRILGIHRGFKTNPIRNLGSRLNYSIEEFNEKNNKNLDKNKIIAKEEIDEINIIYSNYGRKIADLDYLTYKSNFNETLSNNKLFGENFVKINKHICKIDINGKEYELCSYLEDLFNEWYKVLKLKLKGINKITDMSYMFCGCQSLIKLPDIHKINISNVTSLKCFFAGCKYFQDFPDLSKWNLKNVNDISYMFFDCFVLEKISDISKWDTSNIIKMNSIFEQCYSLISLPNISKWNTSKVENMSRMFNYCEKLTKIPDISNWNTDNVKEMEFMFCHCISLSSVPNISKKNSSKGRDMNSLINAPKLKKAFPSFDKDYSNKLNKKEALNDITKIFSGLINNLLKDDNN